MAELWRPPQQDYYPGSGIRQEPQQYNPYAMMQAPREGEEKKDINLPGLAAGAFNWGMKGLTAKDFGDYATSPGTLSQMMNIFSNFLPPEYRKYGYGVAGAVPGISALIKGGEDWSRYLANPAGFGGAGGAIWGLLGGLLGGDQNQWASPACNVFGTAAGGALSSLLQPGMQSLSDIGLGALGGFGQAANFGNLSGPLSIAAALPSLISGIGNIGEDPYGAASQIGGTGAKTALGFVPVVGPLLSALMSVAESIPSVGNWLYTGNNPYSEAIQGLGDVFEGRPLAGGAQIMLSPFPGLSNMLRIEGGSERAARHAQERGQVQFFQEIAKQYAKYGEAGLEDPAWRKQLNQQMAGSDTGLGILPGTTGAQLEKHIPGGIRLTPNMMFGKDLSKVNTEAAQTKVNKLLESGGKNWQLRSAGRPLLALEEQKDAQLFRDEYFGNYLDTGLIDKLPTTDKERRAALSKIQYAQKHPENLTDEQREAINWDRWQGTEGVKKAQRQDDFNTLMASMDQMRRQGGGVISPELVDDYFNMAGKMTGMYLQNPEL